LEQDQEGLQSPHISLSGQLIGSCHSDEFVTSGAAGVLPDCTTADGGDQGLRAAA